MRKKIARQRIYTRPLYARRKKHYCPKCEGELFLKEVSKVVNSNSSEAKDFDFSNGDTFMIGDVKFTWDEFKCSECNFQISINDLALYERKKKYKEKGEKYHETDKINKNWSMVIFFLCGFPLLIWAKWSSFILMLVFPLFVVRILEDSRIKKSIRNIICITLIAFEWILCYLLFHF